MKDRLDWYVEKLLVGTFRTSAIEAASVHLDVLQNPAMFGQWDNLCRVRVNLVDGSYIATEAIHSDELIAAYHAVDKIKSVLIERPSNTNVAGRSTTTIEVAQPVEKS